MLIAWQTNGGSTATQLGQIASDMARDTNVNNLLVFLMLILVLFLGLVVYVLWQLIKGRGAEKPSNGEAGLTVIAQLAENFTQTNIQNTKILQRQEEAQSTILHLQEENLAVVKAFTETVKVQAAHDSTFIASLEKLTAATNALTDKLTAVDLQLTGRHDVMEKRFSEVKNTMSVQADKINELAAKVDNIQTSVGILSDLLRQHKLTDEAIVQTITEIQVGLRDTLVLMKKTTQETPIVPDPTQPLPDLKTLKEGNTPP
jgi:hypothetical protein